MKYKHGLSVLLLAGHRQVADPICQEYKTRYKSLVPVAGVPMIMHPLSSLSNCEYISEIIVMAQEPDILRAGLKDYPVHNKVRFCRSESTIAMTVMSAWERQGVQLPLLITTADNCLLHNQHIDDFITQAFEQPVDVAIGFSRKDELLACHPGSRRTWMQFQDVEMTGCNLFLLRSEKSINAVRFWKEFETRPKKILRMAWMLGPVFFWRYWRRQITVNASFEKISGFAGTTIRPFFLANPEVAIDADKLSDIRQIETILGYGKSRIKSGPGLPAPAKPVVIFDLDRTITRQGTYIPFLIYYALRHNPLTLLYSPVIIVFLIVCKLGLLSRKRLKSIIFGLLIGRPSCTDLQASCEEFVDRTLRKNVYIEALDTIRAWQEKGAMLVLATASYDWMADIFARRLGFDKVVATRSIRVDGHIVAGTVGDNCYGAHKLEMLNSAIGPPADFMAAGHDVWFYSDHHTDISLLEQCNYPVVVNPTRKLKFWANTTRKAKVLVWKICGQPESALDPQAQYIRTELYRDNI